MDRPPRLAFGLLVALVAAVPLLPIHGLWLPAKPLAALVLALLGMGLLLLDAWRGAERPALGTPLDIGVGALLGIGMLSVAGAVRPELARYELARLLTLGLVYVLAIRTLIKPERVRAVLLAALASAAVICVSGLLAYREFLASGASEAARSMALSTAFFPHSYVAVQFAVPSFVAGIVLLFQRGRSPTSRAVLLALLLPVGAFVIVSGSRGATLAIGVALFSSALLRMTAGQVGRGRVRTLVALTARAGVALALVAGALVIASITGLLEDAPELFGRLTALFDSESADHTFSRLRVWEAGLSMAGDHLVRGTGPAGFGSLLPGYMPSPIVLPHAHNQFIQVLVEFGLPGLLALLLMIRAARHAAVRGAAQLEPDIARRALFHAVVAALVSALVYSCFETPLIWTESGVLIIVLLAALGRSGCTSRDRPVARGTIVSSTALVLAVLLAASDSVLRNVPTMAQSSLALEMMHEGQQLVRTDRPRAKQLMETALSHTTLAEQRFPYHARVAELGSRLCVRLGRLDEALEWRKLADRRLPNAYKHLRELGQLHLALNQPAQAIEPLRRALAAHRGIEAAPTYQLLAKAYALTGLTEQAAFLFGNLRRATWHHAHPEMLLPAAGALVELERELDQAETMLADYAERAPDQAERNAKEVDRLTERIAELRAQPLREGRRVDES